MLRAAFLAGAEAKAREMWAAWYWLAAFELVVRQESVTGPLLLDSDSLN